MQRKILTSIDSIYTWVGKFVIQEKALIFGRRKRRRHEYRQQDARSTEGVKKNSSQKQNCKPN